MAIVLSPELEQQIAEKIESGEYSSPNEVILHGLRLIKEQEAVDQMRLEELRRELAKGAEDSKSGNYTDYSSADEMIEAIKAEGKALLAAKKVSIT